VSCEPAPRWREPHRTSRLKIFFTRTPSASTACTSAAEHAPSAPAISIAAQASQHSQSAMPNARTFVRARLPSRAFRAVQSGRRRGLASLGPQLCIRDAGLRNQLNERQTQLDKRSTCDEEV